MRVKVFLRFLSVLSMGQARMSAVFKGGGRGIQAVHGLRRVGCSPLFSSLTHRETSSRLFCSRAVAPGLAQAGSGGDCCAFSLACARARADKSCSSLSPVVKWASQAILDLS